MVVFSAIFTVRNEKKDNWVLDLEFTDDIRDDHPVYSR